MHHGERVLTAAEAQAYVDRSFPNVMEAPRQAEIPSAREIINALGTLSTGTQGTATGDMNITLRVGDVEFYRETLPAFRQVQGENPIVDNDF